MRKQDGGDRCHSRSSRDPQDHWVSCQARSRAADGGVIGLDDLLPRRATKSGSRLRGEPPCSPIRSCRDDHGEMMRCMRTAGPRADSRAAHAGSGSQTVGLVQGSGAESRITAAKRAINTLITPGAARYLMEPALTPAIRYFCRNRYITTAGIVAIRSPAIW